MGQRLAGRNTQGLSIYNSLDKDCSWRILHAWVCVHLQVTVCICICSCASVCICMCGSACMCLRACVCMHVSVHRKLKVWRHLNATHLNATGSLRPNASFVQGHLGHTMYVNRCSELVFSLSLHVCYNFLNEVTLYIYMLTKSSTFMWLGHTFWLIS